MCLARSAVVRNPRHSPLESSAGVSRMRRALRALPALTALFAAVAMPLAAQETSAAAAPNKVAGYNRVKISGRPAAGLYAGSLMKLQGQAIRKGQTEPD